MRAQEQVLERVAEQVLRQERELAWVRVPRQARSKPQQKPPEQLMPRR